MSAYYNEIDPYAAQWLRNLIDGGHIAHGHVDERSIVDVRGGDLREYVQCHFFAGIGGWSYALRLAGISDYAKIWTGSCPCQPLSGAGQRKGHVDERHLWPAFHRLIAECSPPIVFGEQVASKDGREWLSGVRADLEELGYAVGAADLCAASVGAPHIRQRLWWVGHADAGRSHASWPRPGEEVPGWSPDKPLRHGKACGLADADIDDAERWRHAGGERERHSEGDAKRRGESAGASSAGRMGDAESEQARLSRQPWGRSDSIPCSDGKARRVEPGTFPLVDGSAFKLGSGCALEGKSRVGMLRAYGNAIVPQVATEFVGAFMETINAANT